MKLEAKARLTAAPLTPKVILEFHKQLAEKLGNLVTKFDRSGVFLRAGSLERAMSILEKLGWTKKQRMSPGVFYVKRANRSWPIYVAVGVGKFHNTVYLALYPDDTHDAAATVRFTKKQIASFLKLCPTTKFRYFVEATGSLRYDDYNVSVDDFFATGAKDGYRRLPKDVSMQKRVDGYTIKVEYDTEDSKLWVKITRTSQE